MSRTWIDVPQGYLYGFPKIYDPDLDGDLAEWIRAQGYTEEAAWTRGWPVDKQELLSEREFDKAYKSL